MHNSTMTPKQRKVLIRVLSPSLMGHDIKKLAEMTDPELHEQWLIDCEYENPYNTINNED